MGAIILEDVGDVHHQVNNSSNRQELQMKTERFKGMVCGMLNGIEGMVLFGVTDKGNLAQPTLFDFMEGGPGDE